ncbi:MAG TPA: hypothetical protein VH188_05790 [Chthoniobacterales bacterium]|jgi:hypothetical protein|nr:hypothetical protein [Chthoniobacterales bacterium]
MASIDISQLIQSMLGAATGAAKGHAEDLKNYVEAQAKLIAEGAAAITRDRLANIITDDDVRFAWEEIKRSENADRAALAVTLKAAAQDAINAALNVAASAVNSAVGVAIL